MRSFFRTTLERTRLAFSAALLLVAAFPPFAPAADAPATSTTQSTALYINTAFENASPLWWETDASGAVLIHLMYDQERDSPNRASIHWHFQVQAGPGAELTLILHNFDNIWNGKPGSPIKDTTTCHVSPDGHNWRIISTEKIEGNRLRVKLRIDTGSLYVVRLEPYRLSDLARLLTEIEKHPLVKISIVGKTVEGRPLELIQVGRDDAPHRILIRARAHSWEPGGNWVVQGLIRGLLEKSPENERFLQRYCVYVLPLANKDGVARGRTRFNVAGMDLNRKWDRPADPKLCPENHALEQWLKQAIAAGKKPDLAIDLHNDSGGKLHISRPNIPDLERYLTNMARLELLLHEYTWFTEGSTGAGFRNPGSIGEGLLERYGVDALVYELNANWSAGLNKPPSGKDWELLGRQLRKVFYEYFE